MDRIRHVVADHRSQWRAYGLLSLAVIGLAAVSTVTNPQSFRPYFGSVPPLAAIVLVVVLGAVLWTVILSQGWFVVREPGAIRQGLPFVVVPPTLLSAGMIVVDLLVVLPPDLNVPYPDSLFFYPAIGFVVEVVFHLLPLTVLLLAASTRFGAIDSPELMWAVIVVVAVLEPAFQLGLGFSQSIPLWASAYVAANVFAINLGQLYCFRRYDFLAMYSFRLVYYLLWHVAWGHVRLQLLF